MNEQDIKKEITVAQKKINEIVVSDKENFEIAGSYVLGLDALKKKITDYWKDPIEKAHAAHKALTAKRKEMLDPVEANRSALRKKISEYLTEEEKKRKAAQRKLDEEREAAEAKERARLEKRAEKAAEKGNTEKAEELKEEAENVYVPPAVVTPEVAKTTRMESGTVSAKKVIVVEIIDEKKVLAGIVSGILPPSIISISLPKLKKFVEDMGLKDLDGCRITEEMDARFRGAK